LSFYVWANFYGLDPIPRFETMPYGAQSPLTGANLNVLGEADIWEEVEAIAELAKTSKTRTTGQLLYDLVPMFASPTFFTEEWIIDVMNEYHWVKDWHVSPGMLDDVSAFRLDCWTVIENETNQIIKLEKQKDGQ